MLGRRATALAEAQGLGGEPLCAIAYLALGRALVHQGGLADAEEQLGQALKLARSDAMGYSTPIRCSSWHRVRRARGDVPGARTLLEQARGLADQFVDPGVLPALLEQADQDLGAASRWRVVPAAPLTERELDVLRLLATRLSARELGGELYVSINTVRSHVRAIYRKLGVETRSEAVVRARQLGLLPTPDPALRP